MKISRVGIQCPGLRGRGIDDNNCASQTHTHRHIDELRGTYQCGYRTPHAVGLCTQWTAAHLTTCFCNMEGNLQKPGRICRSQTSRAGVGFKPRKCETTEASTDRPSIFGFYADDCRLYLPIKLKNPCNLSAVSDCQRR